MHFYNITFLVARIPGFPISFLHGLDVYVDLKLYEKRQ